MRQLPPNNCRCEALRKYFGDDAPSICSVCRKDDELVKIVEAGFVKIPIGHRAAYEDCGIELRSHGTRETGAWYVPEWASWVVEAMYPRSGFCGPLLKRAANDLEFQKAIESILRLTPKDGDKLWLDTILERLTAFAESQGLQALPPVTL